MEPNGLGGGMYSNMPSGVLGIETPLHQPQNAPNPQHLHHPQMVSYAHHETDHHSQSQPSTKHGYPFSAKTKQQVPFSDEDEPGFAADDSTEDAKRKMSPWQRMKWTDTMVRLLIMAVFYIGDDGGSEATDPTGKKKSTGFLQKKGKWKSVSRAMLDKGFCVSPQQCEDKFNDLNKRYKRVNEILGKGTACRVVENQNLLDSMDLSPKMKEEVRKLLNSKHLFFREMCAYHSNCGHGSSGLAANSRQSPEIAGEPSLAQQQLQQQRCFHSPDNGQTVANLGRSDAEKLKMSKGGSGEEDDNDDEDDSEDDYDEDEEEIGEGGHINDDEDDNDERPARKRQRKEAFSFNLMSSFNFMSSPLMQQFSCEVMSVLHDGAKSPGEKKQWMNTRLKQLEEQQVNYQSQAYELEKQRFKWMKFSSKKEWEMERAKLENDRRRLENERMALLIRQKELELLNLQHQQHHPSANKRGDPSSVTG